MKRGKQRGSKEEREEGGQGGRTGRREGDSAEQIAQKSGVGNE